MGDALKDKVAVVTGGGRGIGRAICLLMAEEGAKVVVNDLGSDVYGKGSSKGPADQVVAEIRAKGGTAVPSYDTVATIQGGEGIIKMALDSFGRSDILVTAAAILGDRAIFDMAEEEWESVITVNLKGTFTVCKYASQQMRQQRYGRIITFTGTSGLYGKAGHASYAAAQDGVAGMTRVMARDLGRYGITVNSISPLANTSLTAKGPGMGQKMAAAKVKGEPEDIAPFVCWLASDEAGDVNGQIFHCSGGLIALMGQPQIAKTVYKGGRWTVGEILAVFPQVIGMDIVNPAPPVPSPSPTL